MGAITSVKPGQRIVVRERLHEESKVDVTYEVKKVYPHVVLCEDIKRHIRRCFCYGDLIMLRLEKQEARLEALKIRL